MNREAKLGVLALLLVVGATGAAFLVPGALAEKSDADLRPSRLALQEPQVATGTVGGEHAELRLDVRMEHRGGTAENVTVEVQAIDTDTGLVATTVRKPLGNVTGDREIRSQLNATVERQGGYRILIRVYEDGRLVERGHTDVSGLESLTPEYAQSSVEFHRYGSSPASIPVITYKIGETDDDRTTLETGTSLTNRGAETVGGLTLLVKARQVESNVIADETTVQVGDIGSGQTVTQSAELVVPSDYNYYLDGVLLKDGVVVGTATSSATLDPSRPVPKNETREEVDFQAGDFEQTPSAPEERDEYDTPQRTESAGGPGFGVAAALAALLAIAAIAARRYQ